MIFYFIPREGEAAPEPLHGLAELIRAGAKWLEPKSVLSTVYTNSGPGGHGGALGVVGRPGGPAYEPELRYDAARQRWLKHPAGNFWVGVEKDALPSLEDLQRSDALIGGAQVKLRRGELATIPICVPAIIRGMSGIKLPMVIGLDEKCQTIFRVEDQYESLANRVYTEYERFIGVIETNDTCFELWMQLAADLLAVNYQVDRVVLFGLLDLLSTNHLRAVVKASFEGDVIDAFAKELVQKKAQEGVEPPPVEESASAA